MADAVPVAVVGVVGDDAAGAQVLAQAVRDGLDVSAVVRRRGAETGPRPRSSPWGPRVGAPR